MKQRSSRKGLSRRSVISGVGAATLTIDVKGALGQPTEADAVATLGSKWQAMRREEQDLSARWSKIESWLIENCGWADLSDEAQHVLPEAKELHAIDAQLAALEEQRRGYRTYLLNRPAAVLEDTLLKLRVVADTIGPIDNWTVHHLLKSAIEELEAFASTAAPTSSSS